MKKILILIAFISNIYAIKTVGEDVYFTNCAACHSITMQGGMGKDFNLVSYTRTKKEIYNYASDPAAHYRKFGYSANAMPTLPLNEQELEDIAEFIDKLQPFKKWMINTKKI